MDLSNIIRPKIKKGKKRVGKGEGSGLGKQAGRGHKGQGSRSGGKIPNWFEGGQMPIQRRLPKRGFHSVFKKQFRIVNLSSLQNLKKSKLTITQMEELGIIPNSTKMKKYPVKVLAKVEKKFNKKMNIESNFFSASAKRIIEENGGKAEVKKIG